MSVTLKFGDCLDRLSELPDNSLDACVTDPPYGPCDLTAAETAACVAAWADGRPYLRRTRDGSMARTWDDVVPGPEVWREVLRVLKPGAHLACFAGTRNIDLLALAIRLGGFEIRDTIGVASGGAPMLAWVYGSGFPKSVNVGNAVAAHSAATGATPEAAAAAANPWLGWGTALKPAWQPIFVARKPLVGTVPKNVLLHGTGVLNIDACRIPYRDADDAAAAFPGGKLTSHADGALGYPGCSQETVRSEFDTEQSEIGRWPANVVHDGSPEVLDALNAMGGGTGASPARFFYCGKAEQVDRAGSEHPVVKPQKLIKWLIRMIVPPNGQVLDPFAGTGSTGQAATELGCCAVLIEHDLRFAYDILSRCGNAVADPPTLPPPPRTARPAARDDADMVMFPT